jgi:hypothetical protein
LVLAGLAGGFGPDFSDLGPNKSFMLCSQICLAPYKVAGGFGNWLGGRRGCPSTGGQASVRRCGHTASRAFGRTLS